MVQLLLGVTGNEFFHQRDAVCERDVFQNLPPECALADRFQPLPKSLKIGVGIEPCELTLKALDVTECVFINDAHQSIEFQERILKRRSCEEELWERCKGTLDGIAYLVGGLVDVPKAVRLVDDREVPSDLAQIGLLRTSELKGTDHDFRAVEGIEIAPFYLLVEGFGLQQHRGQEELVRKLLMPLLAETGWYDDQNLAFSLCPLLGKQNPGFNRLS